MTLENILADFQLLDDWEDRYRYVIELGRALPPLPEAARTEVNRVRGCASQVWLATEVNGVTAAAAPCLIFKMSSSKATTFTAMVSTSPRDLNPLPTPVGFASPRLSTRASAIGSMFASRMAVT